jgi:hypothetical protein
VKCIKISIAACCRLSFSVFADEAARRVKLIYVHGFNDLIAFNMETNQANFTACAITKRYAISTATQQGKNILSTILLPKRQTCL